MIFFGRYGLGIFPVWVFLRICGKNSVKLKNVAVFPYVLKVLVAGIHKRDEPQGFRGRCLVESPQSILAFL